MRWSDERILTTHTGSLPRPPELTRLYVRRARGEAIDPAELDRLGKAALRRIVDKQIEAGVDIGNNGEQQREAFFLYVRHRMSGFGDSWQRWPRGDVERYPLLKQQMAQMLAAREAVGNYQPPKAIGEVRYVDDTELNAEIADFRTALEAKPIGFVEPFMTAPSPGIIAAAMKNEYYDSEEAYLAAVAAAIQVEYEAIVKSGFLLQLDCPDLALERDLTYDDRPVASFSPLSSVSSQPSTRQSSMCRATGCGSTSAGEITRGRTIATSRSPRSCRCSSRPMSAGSCCPSPIPGISMNIACCKNSRSPMIRSSPPASSMI
jgi:5-methyltetrahydropteroyltriglutamate--homocysteine methyltransferase